MTGFDWMAETLTRWAGGPWALNAALGALGCMGLWGWSVGWGEAWMATVQLTTQVSTFVAGFLVLRSQNRMNTATGTKLDALLAATPGASNSLINCEGLDGDDLEEVHRLVASLKKSGTSRQGVDRAVDHAGKGKPEGQEVTAVGPVPGLPGGDRPGPA